MKIPAMGKGDCNSSAYYYYDDEWGLRYWQFCVSGIMVLVISTVGIVLNITTIYIIFPGKPLKSVFNLLLINLFTWDTIFLVIQIILAVVYYVSCSHRIFGEGFYINFLIPFRSIAVSQSIFVTCMLSIERYICLIRPKIYEWLIKQSKSRLSCYIKFILPITILLFLFHIPSFFANKKMGVNDGYSTYRVYTCFNFLEKDHKIAKYHGNYARLLVEGIVPIGLLLYFSIMIYIKVRKHLRRQFRGPNSCPVQSFQGAEETDFEIRESQLRTLKRTSKANEISRLSQTIEHKLAIALIGIVLVFVMCHIPHLVFRFWEDIYQELAYKQSCFWIYPTWTIKLRMVANLMLTLNSTVNVAIYCFLDDNYKIIIISWLNEFCGRKLNNNSDKNEDGLEEMKTFNEDRND